jgi:hypothetical protein
MAGNPDRMQGPQREDIENQSQYPISEDQMSDSRMFPGRGSIFGRNTIYPQGRRYTADLAGLVAECLEYHAHDRPTLDQIQTRANNFLNANPHIRDDPTVPTWREGPVPDRFSINAQLP